MLSPFKVKFRLYFELCLGKALSNEFLISANKICESEWHSLKMSVVSPYFYMGIYYANVYLSLRGYHHHCIFVPVTLWTINASSLTLWLTKKWWGWWLHYLTLLVEVPTMPQTNSSNTMDVVPLMYVLPSPRLFFTTKLILQPRSSTALLAVCTSLP